MRVESLVKRSRFIATAYPLEGEEEGRARLEAARAEFPEATHHCWAWRVGGSHEVTERSSDAGEPAGTAGQPILQAIRSAGLTNLAIVVTRYFGGVKLGKGGLARAYRDAARRALEAAQIVETRARMALEIDVSIERDGEVRHLLARHDGRVDAARYDAANRAFLDVTIPEEARGRFEEDLESLARGEARIRTKS
jgi:uncharacterized YigZ family protein